MGEVFTSQLLVSGQQYELPPYKIVQSKVYVLQAIQQTQLPPSPHELVRHIRQLQRVAHVLADVLSEAHRANGHYGCFVFFGEHIQSFVVE